MNLKLENNGYYSPIYTRTNLTDKLHDEYQFRTDYEILSEKKFFHPQKNRKLTHFFGY
mgnify:CR=1 FL=1